ncbi:MAG: hypothetical protein GF330_03640 [Candidatus Eisenbacteria bacterium]|nr:hypothetical protein [Candidatus Eisenbacteria bacterium]
MRTPRRHAARCGSRLRLTRLSAVAVAATVGLVLGSVSLAYSPERASFALRVGSEEFPYRIASVFLLPGEQVTLEAKNAPLSARFEVSCDADESAIAALERVAAQRWRWRAPRGAGLHVVTIARQDVPDSIRVNLFVLVPYERLQEGRLNDYRVGDYPIVALRGLDIYKPPRGFIEVTSENFDTWLSPHFRLSQFLSKQESAYPKYLVLREKLLLKLELILETVNARGIACESFHVMSGYRTPYYNRAIGNVQYSRHVWGGAADIFIDEPPRDEMMDDLNADGRSDFQDAAILYDIIDDLYGQPFYAGLLGGLARYRKSAAHGPFVHVDVRGFHARWGD